MTNVPSQFSSAVRQAFSRRAALKTASAGFGYLALAGMLGQSAGAASIQAAAPNPTRPLAPKLPHFAAKAKRIIFLFMQGATS